MFSFILSVLLPLFFFAAAAACLYCEGVTPTCLLCCFYSSRLRFCVYVFFFLSQPTSRIFIRSFVTLFYRVYD